jgi:hypothetical protein
MSAEGPPRGRLREQGEAKARRARPRARAAADLRPRRAGFTRAEAATRALLEEALREARTQASLGESNASPAP